MSPLRILSKDERGVTAVEFAIIAPVLFTLLLGGFDVAHTLYMRAALQGIVQKISRDGTLEANATGTAQTTLDNRVRGGVLALASNATVTFNRRYFRTFSAVGKAEHINDSNGNNICDPKTTPTNGETFIDANNNGKLDLDGGDDGGGGAVDRALYTVTVSYPRMFPILYFWGSKVTTVKATTILENQPYSDQAKYGSPTTTPCPPL